MELRKRLGRIDVMARETSRYVGEPIRQQTSSYASKRMDDKGRSNKGRPRKNIPYSYLDLLRKLQFI